MGAPEESEAPSSAREGDPNSMLELLQAPEECLSASLLVHERHEKTVSSRQPWGSRARRQLQSKPLRQTQSAQAISHLQVPAALLAPQESEAPSSPRESECSLLPLPPPQSLPPENSLRPSAGVMWNCSQTALKPQEPQIAPPESEAPSSRRGSFDSSQPQFLHLPLHPPLLPMREEHIPCRRDQVSLAAELQEDTFHVRERQSNRILLGGCQALCDPPLAPKGVHHKRDPIHSGTSGTEAPKPGFIMWGNSQSATALVPEEQKPWKSRAVTEGLPGLQNPMQHNTIFAAAWLGQGVGDGDVAGGGGHGASALHDWTAGGVLRNPAQNRSRSLPRTLLEPPRLAR